MAYALALILLLFQVTGLGSGSDGLKCWVCQSDVLPHIQCSDPFNYDLMKHKNFEMQYCGAMLGKSPVKDFIHYCKKQVYARKFNNSYVTLRYCAWGPPNNTYKEYICGPLSKHYISCDACPTDGCNTSVMYTPTPYTTAAVIWSSLLWLI